MAAAPDHEELPEPTATEFEAFDRFPWSRHRAFLAGLVETLGGVDALVEPSPTHEGSCAFCRTVFFRMQTTRRVDLTRYHQFRASHPAYPSIDQQLLAVLYAAGTAVAENGGVPDKAERSRLVVDAVARAPPLDVFADEATTPAPPLDGSADEATTTPTTPAADDDTPPWMRAAPTAALHVERAARPGSTTTTSGDAPHSDKFAQIVEAIQTGKPVEGIREIPDTVVRPAGVTPVGKLKARPKPWEVKAGAAKETKEDSGLTSILSVLSLGEKKGEEGQEEQQTTAVLAFPPLPEETTEAEAGTGAGETAASEQPSDTVPPPSITQATV